MKETFDVKQFLKDFEAKKEKERSVDVELARKMFKESKEKEEKKDN